MFRFFGLLWDPASSAQSETARHLSMPFRSTPEQWDLQLSTDTARIYSVGARGSYGCYVLDNDRGLVLGRLFTASGNQVRTCQPLVDSENIVATRGASLIGKYWGGYVCVVLDNVTPRAWLLRDPSGSIRCFTTCVHGVWLFFSDIRDCAGISFSIDWEYVIAELTSNALMSWRRTALREVSSVFSGESVELLAGSSRLNRRLIWDPVAIASQPLENSTSLVSNVRRLVSMTVASWSSCNARVALLLSGGLDSSVLLNCIRRARPNSRVACLHLYSPGLDGDERVYARAVARQFECSLVELERARDVNLEDLLHFPRTARPSSYSADHLLFRQPVSRWAQTQDATAIFVGQMGDQLFDHRSRLHPAGDYVLEHGLLDSYARIALDIASSRDATFWSVLLTGILLGFLGRSRLRKYVKRLIGRNTTSAGLLRPDGLRGRHRWLHEDWLTSVDELPLGKLLHIAGMLSSQAYFGALGERDDPEWIMPFNSQLLMELCLRTPTYSFLNGGWDRSPLRRAFADELPQEILLRRGKGVTDPQVKEILDRNMGFIRDLLLDGVLVRTGLTSQTALARYIAHDNPHRRSRTVLRWVTTEAWLRSWNA